LSDIGAHEDDMRFFSRLSDRDTDAILAGNAPAGDDELQELAAFFHDVRVSLAEPPSTAIATTHLAAIAEAARASALPGSEAQTTPEPRQRRLRNPLTLPARLAAAAAGLALLAAFGGAAYAGRLPDPVQDKVADLARNVGLSLPGNANDVDQGDVGNLDTGTQGNSNQGNQEQGTPGSSDAGPQGDAGPGVQNDTNEGAQSGHDDGARANADDGTQGKLGAAGTPQGTADDGADGKAEDDGAQGKPEAHGGAQANRDDGGAQADADEGPQGDESGGDRTEDGNAHERDGGDG
jgi:hypothetical protein